MIFQNLLKLNKAGIYGNSNPEFINDWVDVNIPPQPD